MAGWPAPVALPTLPMNTVRRTVFMPVAHHNQNASRWRFDHSEIDKMEVSTPSAFLKPAYVPNRTEFAAEIFVFFCRIAAENPKNT